MKLSQKLSLVPCSPARVSGVSSVDELYLCICKSQCCLDCITAICRQPSTDVEDEDDEEDKDEDAVSSEEGAKEQPTHAQIMTKATLMLIAGAAVCAVISDPMVDAVSSFSTVSPQTPRTLLQSVCMARERSRLL